ncbi:diguanylate cyclase [Sporosalibacterium faouarense]|uniref:diguanylate cyclase n=1 Tax=Sporosalibacterium faouarense TaxID=516123 RepID=UPI00192CD604|nr:diguanylate cyclase [Sporosalibacterium faouarense]
MNIYKNILKALIYIYSSLVIAPIVIIMLMIFNIVPQFNEWPFLLIKVFLIMSFIAIFIVIYTLFNFKKIYLLLERIYKNNISKFGKASYPVLPLLSFNMINKLYGYIDLIGLENQILYDTALIIHTSATLQELLDTVTARLNTHLKGSFGLIYLLEGNYLQLASKVNVNKKSIYKTKFRMGEGLAGYAAQEDEALLIHDVTNDKRYIKCVEECRSQLTIPLQVYNKNLGVLVLGSYETNHFNEKDLLILKMISSQIALAINNTRLTEVLRKEKENVVTLYETTQQITANIQIDKVMETGVKKVCDITKAVSCSIMLFNEEKQLLEVMASQGLSKETVNNIRFSIGEGIAGKVFQEEKSLLIEDVKQDPQFKVVEGQKEGFKSLYSIPIKTEQKCVGAINIATNKPLSSEEYDLIENIVSQLSISIENALLHSSLEGLAIKDSLTDIYNHRYFQQAIDKEIERAKRYNRDLSLAIIDIDDFKKYNDSYGHMIGDYVIKTVCKILQTGIRESDILARYGGDELIIIFPETDVEIASVVMERLKKEISSQTFENTDGEREKESYAIDKEENPSLKKQVKNWINKNSFLFGNKIEKGPKRITISVGIACVSDLDEEFDKELLIQKADEALLLAKQKGKNQVCSYRDNQKNK